MSRNTVYRSVTPKRRSSVPRMSTGSSDSMTSSFGRMLAKLTGAGESLQRSRPRKRRA